MYRSPSILLVFTMSVCPSAHMQGNEWGGWNRLRKALIKNVYLNPYLMGKSIKGCCTAVPGRVLSLPALPFDLLTRTAPPTGSECRHGREGG